MAVVLAATAAAPRTAAAAPPPPAGSPAAKQEAKALYDQGLRYYNITEYDNAIAAFKKGYELSSEPAFLYNIGQAYRLKGDCAQASRFYRNYLREAGRGPQRADAEKWLKRCDADDAGKRAPAPPPAAAVASPPPAVAVAATAPTAYEPQAPPPAGGVLLQVPASPPPSPGHTKRIAGIATAAAGAALLVGGIAFGIRANNKEREVENFAREGGTWNPMIADVEASGQTAATWSNIFLITGGLALAGGGVLYYLGVRERAAGGGAPLAVSRDGRSLLLGWSWDY